MKDLRKSAYRSDLRRHFVVRRAAGLTPTSSNPIHAQGTAASRWATMVSAMWSIRATELMTLSVVHFDVGESSTSFVIQRFVGQCVAEIIDASHQLILCEAAASERIERSSTQQSNIAEPQSLARSLPGHTACTHVPYPVRAIRLTTSKPYPDGSQNAAACLAHQSLDRLQPYGSTLCGSAKDNDEYFIVANIAAPVPSASQRNFFQPWRFEPSEIFRINAEDLTGPALKYPRSDVAMLAQIARGLTAVADSPLSADKLHVNGTSPHWSVAATVLGFHGSHDERVRLPLDHTIHRRPDTSCS